MPSRTGAAVRRSVDLNADLGEGDTDDLGLLEVVTSANVACGFHAGDAATMRAVCAMAVERGVAIGAHVSYWDRNSFGRRPVEILPAALAAHVAEQVEALGQAARSAGGEVAYVKPHGALYNRVVVDEEQAEAVLTATRALPVLGLPGSVLLRLARAAGRGAYPEGFPDRAYTPEGRLMPREQPDAVLHDPAVIAQRALAMAMSGEVASVCVHGDSPGAVAAAQAVRRALTAGGIALASFV